MRTFVLEVIGLCLFNAMAFGGVYGGGRGTVEDPWQIWGIGHFNELAQTPEDYNKQFILMTDLDLNGITYEQAVIAPDRDPETWGHQGAQFKGTFDGNGFTIHNLTINNPSGFYISLIGRLGGGGVVRNLRLKRVNIIGQSSVAGLTSEMEGYVSNCSVEGRIQGQYYAAALVAYNDGGTIEDCRALSVIVCNKVGSFLGGLLSNNNRGIVRRCYAGCSIVLNQPGSHLGGLTAANWKGTIEQCLSTLVIHSSSRGFTIAGGLCGENKGILRCSASMNTDLRVPGDCVGGLVGHNESTIESCYAEGKVFGKVDTGGLVGLNSGYILDSYSDVAVCGQGGVGGFSGTNLYGIARSYSLGRVAAMDEPPGGFVGRNEGRIEMSYWNIETSGISASEGGMPLTSAQFRNPEMFAGWGDGRWVIAQGNDRPRLVWEKTQGIPYYDAPAVFSGGTGTPEDPYIIDSIEQLSAIGNYPQDLSKCYSLAKDLDFGGAEFAGIGIGKGFDGTFDGNGHQLSNILLVDNEEYTAVFPYIQKNGVVRNLHLMSIKIEGLSGIGALSGKNEGVIERCTADNITINCLGTDPASYVGGLVGYNSGVIRDASCKVKIVVEGNTSERFGGLVGFTNGLIERCGVRGSMQILGADSRFFGGFAGFCDYDSIIQDCFCAVDIDSKGQACCQFGGFTGIQCFRTRIRNTLYVGKMSVGTDNKCFGGFVGVNGHPSAGSAVLNGCFWDTELSGINVGVGQNNTPTDTPIGSSTVALQLAQTYIDAGWSLGNDSERGAWRITAGQYPVLYDEP